MSVMALGVVQLLMCCGFIMITAGWRELLNDHLAEVIERDNLLSSPHWGGGEFPVYHAIFDLNLTPVAINLLYQYSAWVLRGSSEELKLIFG